MTTMSGVLLPYDPQYVGHREAEKRRRETREWLRQRELKLLEPDRPERSRAAIAGHHPGEHEIWEFLSSRR